MSCLNGKLSVEVFLDIQFFLKERLKFAKYFYDNSSKSFLSIMSDIENKKTPYIPQYSETEEPPFLCEWLEARDGLNSVGLATISMLSSAIQLYLIEWADRIERASNKLNRKGNKGWLNAYKKITEDFGVDYSKCPANFDLIEQTVLARNRTQHVEGITSNGVNHSPNDLSKYPSPHFVSDSDETMYKTGSSWWAMPEVHINEANLNAVVCEIDKLCDWLESEYESLMRSKYAK
jgi:hypothetical protein